MGIFGVFKGVIPMPDKQLYVEKNTHLSTYYEEVTPMEFYRDIFSVGSFERKGRYEDQKPNGIVIDIDEENRVKRYTVTDELEQLRDLQGHGFSVLSPIGYSGKRRTAENARFLYALTIDLDSVKMENLQDLLHQMENEFIPQATYIVNSGNGVHIYYVFETPIPMHRHVQAAMKKLKYELIRKVWNRYTSSEKEPQMQGIMQGFRMVGSQSKLGKKYLVKAFKTGPKITVEYLNGFVSEEFRVTDLKYHPSKISLNQAKSKYPEWYEKRILQKQVKGRWEVKRDLYDWWLRRISNEITVGHRYFGIMTLAIYAKKCNIDEEELEQDAFSLLEKYDAISKDKKNRFTRDDVINALEMFNESYVTFPRSDIAKLTGLEIKENKRNNRKQEIHLKIARSTRDIIHENWREGNGRPKGSGTKEQMVKGYVKDHPEANVTEIAKALGISRPTVYKYNKG